MLAQFRVPCPSLHERIYLTSFSTSASPGIGKEGSQLENRIQDLFPFCVRQLDKTFTDVLCVREPLPKENQRGALPMPFMQQSGLGGQRGRCSQLRLRHSVLARMF